jgi:hypothetical protein
MMLTANFYQVLLDICRWLCSCGVLHAWFTPLFLQELTKSMGNFGFDILQALVNDIAPAAKVRFELYSAAASAARLLFWMLCLSLSCLLLYVVLCMSFSGR